jgi:hypothetical protein
MKKRIVNLKMQKSLCPGNLLTTTPTEMPLGSLEIVIEDPDLSGHRNLGEAGRSWVIDLPISTLLSLDRRGLR